MQLETHYGGTVELTADQCVEFPQGILGFPTVLRFAITEVDDACGFYEMHALDDPHVAFLLMRPFDAYPTYEFSLGEEEKAQLEITQPSEVDVFVIVTCAARVEEFTINLLAPIVWNKRKRRAAQIVLHDATYTTKHPLFPHLPQDTSSLRGGSDHVGAYAQET